MGVTINSIRGSSAYSGDLSGSFMSPEVVGLKGIAISGLPTSDNDTLLFNSASNEFYFSASADGGLSTVTTSGNITGSGDVSNPVVLKDDISLTSVTASFVGSLAGIASYASDSALLDGRDSTTFAATGSNVFRGNQTVSGSSTALFVYSTGSTTTSTTHAFKVMQSGSSYGGFSMGMVSNSAYPRFSALNSLGNTGAAFIMQPDGGDVYMFHGGSKFIMASSFPTVVNTHRFQVYATSPLSGAILIHTGTVDIRNGTLNVTGSTNINGNLTAATASITSDLTIGGNLFVNGSRTVVNTTDLTITDNIILIASGASTAAQLDGAGIHFGRLPSEDARIIYDAVNDEMEIYPAARSAEFRGSFAGSGAGLTGVLTSSYATNADTAQTASYVATASYATNAGTAATLSGFNATNPSFTAVTASYFTGSYLGDGTSLTGIPYDVAGEVTGSIVSGSELLNYLSPRAFTMQAFSQYTGSGAASAYVMKNGVSSSFPTTIAANDLITIISTTTGSKAYFTIKGAL